ncbi:pimeloyl-ACP methyl ester carboxylesterase [Natranaerovirga hydrolytica]|uniref:Pimeloyl-ACP methyl ester carboxylesterase n=1 Tax=Natranaerovirga hydrolytica TaxID=680378 RepID=A0A4R1MDP2_9FIRM|nr:alpha/beta hydrolase [Natranaerovirga hydrolytica]TCK89154.1 pimeloyl-ACP methyl ester carboxylesterase [Natranaerovirga hydrolytica]
MIKIVLGLVSILIASTFYHQMCKKIEFRQNPPPGKMIEIGGDKMHIYGQGEGEFTIVFTSGGSGFAYGHFYEIFNALAENNRVVVYDRFGYGWSDTTSRPRTLEQINKDLYELLDKSGETGPYILVGHSIGGTEVLQFAQRYPEVVEGVVMLDAGSVSYHKEEPPSAVYPYLLSFARFTGLLRFDTFIVDKLNLSASESMFPRSEEVKELSMMMHYNRLCSRNSIKEINQLSKNKELENTLWDIPLLLLTANDNKLKEHNKEVNNLFMDDQKNLLEWSTNSKQRLINGNHMFLLNQPDVVTEEILDFLDNRVE